MTIRDCEKIIKSLWAKHKKFLRCLGRLRVIEFDDIGFKGLFERYKELPIEIRVDLES